MAFDTPGVYINYKTDGPLVIRSASTSTAVFIGPTIVGTNLTGSGSTLVVTPTFVSSLTEYADVFSTPGARSGVVCLPTTVGPNAITDTMGHALRGFFMNGGQNAYIVSLSTGTQATATGTLTVTGPSAASHYRIDAKSPGAWGNSLTVTTTASAIGAGFLDVTVQLSLTGDTTAAVLTTERFIGVAATDVANLTSNLVTLTVLTTAPTTPDLDLNVSAAPTPPTFATDSHALTGGANSNATTSTDMAQIFDALRDYDDISIIVLPDRTWPTHQADYALALAHCQAMKDRVTLIQLADDQTDFANVSVPLDKFAAVYYPSARVVLPIPGGSLTATVNTVGHVAGVIARTDAEKGAFTAPAGVHASIAGVTELSLDISQSFQARMNPNNINALRYIQGIPVVWGARTRDMGGIYEYLPVMRTAILIADTLREALNRVVFAKNTEALWANIKAGVNGFMDGLYTQGAFQGATPSRAFRVSVGLNESMTQADIRAGILRLNVAFAPAFVAEFIEISIEQIFEAA